MNRRQQAFALHEREIRVHIGERNDHGGAPEDNRDALGHASLLAGHLLVLASGLGGSRGGRVEGNLAVSAVLTHFRTTADQPVQERLASSMNRANEVLAARAARDPALQGSGASCAALLIEDGALHGSRAGEVRVFLVRGDAARELLVASEPEPADYAHTSAMSVRVGALGAGAHARFLTTPAPVAIAPGDRIIITSPGLHGALPLEEIARIAASHPPQVASGRLVDAARDRGARGGLSVQVVQYGEPGAEAVEAASVPLEVPDSRWSLPDSEDLPRFDDPPSQGRPRIHLRSAAPTPQADPPRRASQRTTGQERPMRRDPIEVEAALDAELATDLPQSAPPSTHELEPGTLGKALWAPARGPATQRLAIPLAAAFLALAAILLWRPWSSDPETDEGTPEPPVAAIVEDTEPDPPVRARAPRNTALEEAAAQDGDELEVPIDLDDLPPAVEGAGFWTSVDGAMRSGEPVTRHIVTEWLDSEGDDAGSIEERARARLAELQTVEAGLAAILVPEELVRPKDQQALDRIFQKRPGPGAQALRRYIELEYESRQDDVFRAIGAYVRTHRTPETIGIILELADSKTGPKTRAWLRDDLTKMLSGP